MADAIGARAEEHRRKRRQETIQNFKEHVNLTARQLERWLQTEDSRSSGRRRAGASESIGHESGRKIVGLLRKNTSEYDGKDLAHMRKVVGYIKRHLNQRPDGDITETRWRYSLMNWGHDPLKT
ncbi:DUF3140 domain-containing protein [Tautonia rosea]|uniref:DUF3140 domain-containing protein n=1 Tax=Tautonia rosea TaxID=2728037 RepID=UPI0014745749|nr:DUF3140 domain-containing protein [Tautonia rosea]